MGDTARFKYVSGTPGADANTYNLFNSAIALQGAGMAANLGYKRLMLDIKNSQAGTLKLYKSPDRGVNWYEVFEVAVAAAAATGTNDYDLLVEEYEDFKADWVNGGVAQATWQVSIALTDSRNPAF